MNLLTRWIILTVAIAATAYLLPGVEIANVAAAIIAAAVLGIINAVVRPILIILTLPINILTLGLFTFVINAALVLLVSALVPGFIVIGFWWALLFSLVVAIVNMLLKEAVAEATH